MRRIVMIILVMVVLLPGVGAQILGETSSDGSSRGAQVFVVNLWSAAVDIQLGDQPLFSVAGLPTAMPASMQVLSTCTPAVLYYKPSSETAWRRYVDAHGTPYAFSFQNQTTYMIRIVPDGTISVLAMAKTKAGAAHIALLNASGNTLDEISLLPGTTQPVLQAQQVQNQAFTEFADVPAGRYAGLWRVGQNKAYTPGSSPGTIGLVNLQPDSWYFLIIANQVDTATGKTVAAGNIWDISPVSGQAATQN